MAVTRQLASLLVLRHQMRNAAAASRSFSAHAVLKQDNKQIQEVRNEQRTLQDSKSFFESQQKKDRQTFRNAIDLFNQRDSRKRGSVEFINAAVKNMKQFGVHRDLDSYRALVDILPKGKMVATNRWQKAFVHYPKQQDCIVQLMIQMEDNKVIPDEEFGDMLENIFGLNSDPMKKFMRMTYWMHKFKNKSQWPLPHDLPIDNMELAKLAIERITSVDRTTEISVYDAKDLEESVDKTWIVSGQSPDQKDLIKTLPKSKALYIEGAFRVWLRDSQVNYFILRGDPVPIPADPIGSEDDVADIRVWTMGQHSPDDLIKMPSIHEQEDGTIFGCCATGTSSKDSLLSWVRFLQRENPDLQDIPIVFSLTSPMGPMVEFEDKGSEVGGAK